MKPAPFRHYAPATVEQAAALLARLAPADGRGLAGGQNLVPITALRRARPAHLIDINGIAALDRRAVVDGNASGIGWTATAARSLEQPA
jgi:carbon-monoxide dehydrogenase medium subunit